MVRYEKRRKEMISENKLFLMTLSETVRWACQKQFSRGTTWLNIEFLTTNFRPGYRESVIRHVWSRDWNMQRPALTESSNKTTKLAYQLPFLRISGRDTSSFLRCLSLSSRRCNISAKNIGMFGAYLSRVIE